MKRKEAIKAPFSSFVVFSSLPLLSPIKFKHHKPYVGQDFSSPKFKPPKYQAEGAGRSNCLKIGAKKTLAMATKIS